MAAHKYLPSRVAWVVKIVATGSFWDRDSIKPTPACHSWKWATMLGLSSNWQESWKKLERTYIKRVSSSSSSQPQKLSFILSCVCVFFHMIKQYSVLSGHVSWFLSALILSTQSTCPSLVPQNSILPRALGSSGKDSHCSFFQLAHLLLKL